MTILTIGTFDLPHVGHINLLNRAAAFPEATVIVGVNSDAFVEKYKGTEPVLSEKERQAFIEALGYRTLLNDGPGAELIRQVQPSILLVGSDWLVKDYLKQIDMTEENVRKLDLSIMFVPYTDGISTTDIKARVK